MARLGAEVNACGGTPIKRASALAEVRQQTGAVGGGAIMEGWNSTIILQLEIGIPPIALQYAFAGGVADVRRLEAAQAARRQRLDDLFQSLLHRAFQGEL